VSAGVQILVSHDILDWAVVIWVLGADLVAVGFGIVRSVKIDVSFLIFHHISLINFVKIVNLILILTLLIVLRIGNKVNLLCLLLVLWVGLALHNDLIWHVWAIILWNNVLAWIQNNHLLELVLVVLECLTLILIVMLHLLLDILFFVGLHLWDSNDLVTWMTVALLDWLNWHGVSLSILVWLLGWNLDILLHNKIILGSNILSLGNLNILRFNVLDDSLILFQKLSWLNVLSHNQASVRATRCRFRCAKILLLDFFNWIILWNLILRKYLVPILIKGQIFILIVVNWQVKTIHLLVLLLVLLKLLWKLKSQWMWLLHILIAISSLLHLLIILEIKTATLVEFGKH